HRQEVADCLFTNGILSRVRARATRVICACSAKSAAVIWMTTVTASATSGNVHGASSTTPVLALIQPPAQMRGTRTTWAVRTAEFGKPVMERLPAAPAAAF